MCRHLVAVGRGYSPVVAGLTAVASLVAVLGLESQSVVVLLGLSCSMACGIFQTRTEPASPALHGGSLITNHQGSLAIGF